MSRIPTRLTLCGPLCELVLGKRFDVRNLVGGTHWLAGSLLHGTLAVLILYSSIKTVGSTAFPLEKLSISEYLQRQHTLARYRMNLKP